MILFIIISCDSPNILNYLDSSNSQNKDEKISNTDYFDVLSFLHNSFNQVKKQHTILKKTMIYNAKKDTLITTNFDLEKVLSFSKDLDIRGKKYIGKFKTTKEKLKSGILVWVYKQNKKEKVVEPLYQLNIEFFNKDLEVSKISAHLFFINILYAKKEIIEMNFDREGILKNYHITGGSKMIGQDTTQYEVMGTITVKNEL